MYISKLLLPAAALAGLALAGPVAKRQDSKLKISTVVSFLEDYFLLLLDL